MYVTFGEFVEDRFEFSAAVCRDWRRNLGCSTTHVSGIRMYKTQVDAMLTITGSECLCGKGLGIESPR